MGNSKFHLLEKLRGKNHIGKKLMTLTLIGSSVLMLTACGKKSAEVKVSSGSYVQETDKSAKSGEGYLALKVNVKNTTGEKLVVSSDDFKLKKDDETISPETMYLDGMKELNYQKVDKDDSVSGYVFFKVDKDDKYELKYTPEPSDYEKDDKLKSTTTEVNASKYKDPGESAKKAAKQYVEAVFFNDQNAQEKNNLENNVKEDAKNYHDEFVKDFRDELGEDAVSDQQADKIFQDYINDGKKRDEISYEIYEAKPNEVTIEVNAKTVDIGNIDVDQLMSNFEDEFLDKHKDDDEINEDEVVKEATQYLIDKLPELISKEEVSTDSDSGYRLKMKKTNGKWEIETTGSDADDYSLLKEQFLGGLSY
ncbi:DUF4352 domain-containing protein [Ligilactobacillus sp. LYQ135]